MGQDVGQAHVLLSDTLQTGRSARPYRGVGAMWGWPVAGDRRSHRTGDRLRSGDEESDSPLLDAGIATSIGNARIEKRRHGSKRPELRAVPRRAAVRE